MSVKGLEFSKSGYKSQSRECNFKSLDTSLATKTKILKVLILVSISRLKYWKSRHQSWYQDCNPESINTSLYNKTDFSKFSISTSIENPSLAHHCCILNWPRGWFTENGRDLEHINYAKYFVRDRTKNMGLEFKIKRTQVLNILFGCTSKNEIKFHDFFTIFVDVQWGRLRTWFWKGENLAPGRYVTNRATPSS